MWLPHNGDTKMNPPYITPADLVYGFGAWLTSREIPLTVSASHDATDMASAVFGFCQANGFNNVSQHYPGNLKFPNDEVPIGSEV